MQILPYYLKNNIESFFKRCLIPEKITKQIKYETLLYLNIKKKGKKDNDNYFLSPCSINS